MDRSGRNQVRDVFLTIAELPDAERPAALAKACSGDAELRREVEALLRAASAAGGFMTRPTGDRGGASALQMDFEEPDAKPSTAEPGERIGPYKLLELLGEGGFGSVWMAEQRAPVKRRVAVKLIKLGMDTKQVVARFEAERQALAMMDHPNIAKALDAGSTETGRPYFVMEYIRGVPILEYCDRERLDTEARLRLFADVCHAIQHAHHKGVIHRDIKPSNVLVTLHDGVPAPKVIDFGIAKAMNCELTTKTLFTEHRQMIGTPAYMSPEQAEMSGLDIDTRSDVYSLGVLLYEMLTGTTPFDVYDLRAKGYEEMLRMIREDEPHKPSTRVSTPGEDAAEAAERRRAHDPDRLSGLLRGDLDRIVMKCLEKDRTRRYETANGLAADVERHLRNEPVAAVGPGAVYRLRKFVRRHRSAAVAASLVVGILVLGVVGTTAGMLRANAERDRAASEKTRSDLAAASEATAKHAALRSAESARAAAERARVAKEDASAARRRAEAISAFVVAALRSGDAAVLGGGRDVTILDAMDRAVAEIAAGRFAGDPATEADLKGVIGHILFNNGRRREAEALLRQALESERARSGGDSLVLSRLMNNLALALGELDRVPEARAFFAQALEMNRRLFPEDSAVVARSLDNLGGAVDPKEGEVLRRRSLEIRRRLAKGDGPDVAHSLLNLGFTIDAQGRPAEAEPLYAEAVAMGRRVFKFDHPFLPIALDNLGKLRQKLGRGDEGVALLAEALAIRRRLYRVAHPDLLVGLHNLACALKAEGRFAEAEPLFAESLAVRRKLAGGDSWETAKNLCDLVDAMDAQDRLAEAAPLMDEAAAICRRLDGDCDLAALVLNNLGNGLVAVGRPAEGEAVLLRAVAMRERLHPGDHEGLAQSLRNLASAERDQRRFAEAEATQARSLAMFRRLYPDGHKNMAAALQNLGMIFERQGRDAEALPYYEAALEMDGEHPPDRRSDLLSDKMTLACAYSRLRKYEKSAPLFEELVKDYENLRGRRHPRTLLVIGNLGANYRYLGRVAEAVLLLEEAWRGAQGRDDLQFVGVQLLDAYVSLSDPSKEGGVAKAMVFFEEFAATRRAATPEGTPARAVALASLSVRLLELRQWGPAETMLREVTAIREAAEPDAWRTFNARSMLGEALLGLGRNDEAEDLLLEGYRGMKARETTIEPEGRLRIPQALERLVKLYETTGDPQEAAAWRARLDAARRAESRAATRRSDR